MGNACQALVIWCYHLSLRSFWHVHDTNGEKMNNSQRFYTAILALVMLLVAISCFSLSKASAAGQPTPVVTSKPVPTSTADAESKQESAPTMMQSIGSIINSNAVIAFVTLLAVIAAFYGIYVSQKQAEKDRAFNQQQAQDDREANQEQAQEDRAFSQQQALEAWNQSQNQAAEERQYQSRPILVPKGAVSHNTVTYFNMNTGESSENLYTSDHNINWGWQHEIRIKLHNMGNGPAFNLHCVLYGPRDTCQDQFVSWDNGPIEEKVSIDVNLAHSSELRLHHNDFIDGMYPLYDRSLDSPSNPWAYRIACLTITYHDLFRNKYVSIFHHTLKHRWIHMATEKINGNPSFDLKELNEEKKQAPKLSAPPVQTSP
jgi:hypothetical protein